MDDFGFVVYMDVQKTGSTFISQFLRDVLGTGAVRASVEHGRIRKRREGAIYFASVRHPFETWHSLFRYGCDRKGNLAGRMRKAGFGHLYQPTAEGFARWLDFVLDEGNAGMLGEGYGRVQADLMGLQTFRFLTLSFPRPLKRLQTVHSVEDLDALYDREAMTSFVVRNEHMNDDLMRLFREHLAEHVELEKVQSLLENAPRLNSSKTAPLTEAMDPAIVERLLRKEAFLIRRFYS